MLAIELHEARSRLKALIDAARSGEEVYISAGESGAVRLTPCDAPEETMPRPARRPGRLREQIRIAEDFDSVDEAIADSFDGSQWGSVNERRVARHAYPTVVACGRWKAAEAISLHHRRRRHPPCFVSAATIWEIGIKRALGKLDAPANLVGIVQDEGFHLISITAEHAEAAAALPPHHRDPFDRMLIAQAVIEDLHIATVDARFSDYDAPLMPETQHK
jgi:PIN domain nuclease of toxin-antitoxin system/antitoxin (DNA-binding transcriptional repressor) of toxin-antitoxin stability system